MRWLRNSVCSISVIGAIMPLSIAFAAPQAQPPDVCEMGVNAAARDCSNGFDRRQFFYKTDVDCASRRIGISTYTAELTSFNDSTCTWGACNNSVAGIAHRTWPPGSKVEVCNVKNGRCAIAQVMDRGPNVCLLRRTIDANPALQAALDMRGGTVPATYTLLGADGVLQHAEPQGMSAPSIEAIIAASNVNNQGMLTSKNYSAINTPWGPGYLGTPIEGSSNGGSAVPSPTQQTNGYGTPGPVSSQINTNPSTNGVGNNAGSALTAALNTTPMGTPALGIVARLHTYSRTNVAYVAWSSLNMEAGSCRVILQSGEVVAQSEGGGLAIPSIGSGGTIRLRCTSRGQAYAASATVQ